MLNLILRTLLALSFVFTAPAYGQNEIFYNDLKIGREQESDISIEANIGRTNNPQFRYNVTLSEWEFSDDGVTFISLSDLLIDISGKADVDSPSFTGTPTAPTPLTGDDSNKIATTEFVQDAISNFGAGDVMGPESSTDSAIALFDGVTGKVLKNSSVTVDSNGSITTGSLWLGSASQILSSTGTLSLGSSGVITRTLGQFNAYGVVTSNTTTDSTSTGEDAVVSTPTTKVLRLTNGSLESISEIGVGLNSQELVLINSTGKEIFLNTDGNISSPDGRSAKLNNGSITSLLYDNTFGKWVISSGSGGGGISKWTAGTAYFIDDVVIYSDSIYQSIANSSDMVFDPLKWELISFDTKISNETESFKVQNIEARRVVKTGDDSALIEPDQSNFLINGSFEHQTATTGWSITSLATASASTSDVFDGKKKVCLSGIGSIFQMLSDTDKYHGRKFIARFNIQNPQGKEGRACIYDGEDLHNCVQIRESDEFVEYTIFDTFIKGNSYGVIVNSLELGGICVDAVSVKLDQTRVIQVGVQGLSKKDAYSPAFRKVDATSTSVKEGTSVTVGETNVTYSVETPVILPALTPGTDYAIYACADGSIRASDNWTAPPGYDTTNSRKIGGFHYGLVSPTETLAGGGFATTGNGMIWTQGDVDRIKGINEFSIWDIKFRPKTNDPRGMALVANSFWVDIYLTGTNHEVNGTSKYNTDVASGTVLPKIPTMFGGNGTSTYANGSWYSFNEIARSHGKRLLKHSEFILAAYGVTENQSIGTGAVSTTTGQALGSGFATIAYTGRVLGYTSKWGLEQTTGNQYTWGEDSSYSYGDNASFGWRDVNGSRGQVYTQGAHGLVNVILGGTRSDAARSGSRASFWGVSPSHSGWSIGLRAACDHLVLE